MKTALLSTLAILTTIPPLRAETPRYGVQGLINIPLTDLKKYVDSKPGPGVGVHGTFDLGDGHMLRPRLDYTVYPEAAFATLKQTATNIGLGGDYLYFVAGKPEGFYLTTGLAAVRWSFETKTSTFQATSHTTKAGIAAGVGYQWSAVVGTEARYLHSRIARDFRADAMQLGVTVRF